MSNAKHFSSHQWRFCTRKFFKQNCFPTDATTWMKVNGTRTVHVQGVNIFLFSHIAYQQYSYPCIAKFGLTRSTSMSYISSTGGCTKTGWASKSSKGFSLTAKSVIGVVQSMYCAQGGPNDLHGHRYFTMWKPQYFRSQHWRLCTRQFFKQNCFPAGPTPWMKLNGTYTVHVQGVNNFFSYCLSAI